MFAYIEGTLQKTAPDYIILENQGIGYQIYTAVSRPDMLPAVGSPLKIYTYFQAGEAGVFLYGFLSEEEKELFLQLITVSGIGPKGALSMLGTLSVRQIELAILGDDEKTLAKAPGIGKKTARRLILDLKDKMSLLPEEFGAAETEAPVEEGGVRSEAILALQALGYPYAQAAAAVQAVPDAEGRETGQLLKEALKHIG